VLNAFRCASRRRSASTQLLAAALSLGWCVLVPAPGRTDESLVVEHGIKPERAVFVGDVDSIRLFNGALSIAIPIGQRYRVGPQLSYALTLTYDTQIWDYRGAGGQAGGPVYTQAHPVRGTNAGFGWRLSLGEYWDETSTGPGSCPRCYIAPDGTRHQFYNSLHPDEPDDGVTKYTVDGTYLRLRTVGDEHEIDFPNGEIHRFDAAGRLAEIRDSYGNTVTQSSGENSWTISDSHGRSVTINAIDVPYYHKAIDSVVFRSFGDSPGTPGSSIYKFTYEQVSVPRSCMDTDPDTPNTIALPLLTSIRLPDNTTYSMPTSSYHLQTTAPSTCELPEQDVAREGVLTGIELPLGGSVEWTYQPYRFPGTHPEEAENRPWLRKTMGVFTRTLRAASGAEVGTWIYTQTLNDFAEDATESITSIVSPLLDRSDHYFFVGHEQGPPYGLPFSFEESPPGRSDVFRSSKIYDCDGGGNNCELVRSTFLRYRTDSDGPFPVNPRVEATHTVFNDDNDAWIAVDYTEFDGLGHFRTVRTTDNFGFGTDRTEITGWNQKLDGNPRARPDAAHRWIINSFAFQEQYEGSDDTAVNRQEFALEQDPEGYLSSGFVRCSRRLASGRNRGPFDVVVVFNHTSPAAPGQVTAEDWYGGEKQPIATVQNCGGLPNSPSYSYVHEYTDGTRSKTTVQIATNNGSTPLNLLDLTVEPNTGLPSVSRDPSGRPTDLAFDPMARPSTVIPRGDALTRVNYLLNSPTPVIERLVNPNSLLESRKTTLDGFGKPVRDEVMLPANVTSAAITTYNAMGWRTYVSERSANPAAPTPAQANCAKAVKGTQYCNHDPFGRPATILRADGKSTTLSYQGGRVITRTNRVWTGTKNLLVTTREEYDGLGRLRLIKDPNGIWTRYNYDVSGSLAAVTSNSTGANSQQRTFLYDGRGFLTEERQPESGKISYQYDAKGAVTMKATPTGTLFFDYDAAGRLTKVSSPRSPRLRELHYEPTGSSAGKLKQAQAFNDRFVGNICTRFEVRQDFTYHPTHGRLMSEETTLLQDNLAQPLEKWSQTYAYDGAGRVTQVTYPSCILNCSAQPRSVTTHYQMGRPTSVDGFALAILYHDNGLVKTIEHDNHVVFSQAADASGISRPGSIKAVFGSTTLWSAEAYTYDGSGNIRGIGTQSFRYDAGSRLIGATLPAAGTPSGNFPYREYRYDALGNLTRVSSGAAPGNISSYVEYSVNTATNRLQGVGISYDDSGNLTSHQGSTYTWDSMERLAAVNTGGETWVHTYDVAGERVWSWRTSPSRLDTFALRGLNGEVLSDFTKEGSAYTWEDYVYRGTQLLGAMFWNGRVTHFDVDHLGSVRLETDRLDPVGSSRYRQFWPYGEQASPAMPAATDTEQMKFTGHERDIGNPTSTQDDLDYMHARFYKPLPGRFLSPDPVISGGARYNPAQWNRYAYTAGNPLNRVDYDGRNWFHVAADKGDRWEWHEGATYKDANGKTYTSNYTHFLSVQAVGEQENGATIFQTTLYNQNKPVHSHLSTSGGETHHRIPAGNYFINADRKYSGPVYVNPNSALGNPHSFYGIQMIPNEDFGVAVRDAYGPIRAYLNPLDIRNAPPSMLGNYYHGQATHRGGVTHGCLCYGQDSTILNYLWKQTGQIPVAVDTPVDPP
jgi:RHS repeat-associated protein